MKPADGFPTFTAPLVPCNMTPQRCAVPRETASPRIIIMRLAAHGDVLMAAPLLAALRHHWPNAHITWIVERKERESIDASPFIDELLLWDGRYWKQMLRNGLFPLWLARALKMRRTLRKHRYDIFISLQPEEWPLLTRAIGAPISIGVFDTFRQFNHDQPTSRSTRLFTTSYTYPDLPAHRTDQYLLPLKALNLPPATDKFLSMGFTAEDTQAVRAFLRQSTETGKSYVVLAPMTTWPSRCWPAERYAALGDNLTEKGYSVVLIGSAKEKASVDAIAALMRTAPAVAAGSLTFRQVAALLAGAALLISGDTGPMHVAAAIGTRYVALFGATPVLGRAPLAGTGTALSHAVPCGPCDKKVCQNRGEDHLLCLRLITVEEVLNAAEALLPSVQVPA